VFINYNIFLYEISNIYIYIFSVILTNKLDYVTQINNEITRRFYAEPVNASAREHKKWHLPNKEF